MRHLPNLANATPSDKFYRRGAKKGVNDTFGWQKCEETLGR